MFVTSIHFVRSPLSKLSLKDMPKNDWYNKTRSKASSQNTRKTQGGETHQQARPAQIPLTTNQGLPVSDNQNSLRGGSRGPTLLEDFAFCEKITHFDDERTPERIVHARGAGAHEYFQPHQSMLGPTPVISENREDA